MAKIGSGSTGREDAGSSGAQAGNSRAPSAGSEGPWNHLFKPSSLQRAADWYDFDVSCIASRDDAPDERLTVNFELDPSENPLKQEQMEGGFVRIDESDQESRVQDLLGKARAGMVVTGLGDLVGTWAPNDSDLAHLAVTHRCSLQRDAEDRLFLWWYTSPLVSLGSDEKTLSASLWRISTILSPATYLAESNEGAIMFPTRFIGSVYTQLRKDVPMFFRPHGSGAESGMIDVLRVPLRVDLGYLIPFNVDDEAVVTAIQLAISVGNRVAATIEDGYTNHQLDPGFSFHEVLLSGAANEVRSHEDEKRVVASSSGQLWIPSTRVFEYPGAWPTY